ncbi:hypothetical protein BpHYR1_033477 [Brachionus plicatilis]|uniref:RNA-directed DNA polymerase from mobile element jockey-like n=1 Tax=Brachionus plicatilis TaxID=10195 RepID=A0A3M7QW22_BRAPC|nr:hypothetical protein BpHYR1_033477 [Brachionus plicatilis]
MEDSYCKGRPYGGKCLIINKDVDIDTVLFDFCKVNFSSLVARIHAGDLLTLIGAWLPYDDGSLDRIVNYKTNLAAMEAALDSTTDPVLLLVDWNSDLKIGNRFDSILNSFVERNDLIDLVPIFRDQTFFTTDVTTDRVLIISLSRNVILTKLKAHVKKLTNKVSDHFPIVCELDLGSPTRSTKNKASYYRFYWKNLLFQEDYKSKIERNLKDPADDIINIDKDSSRVNSDFANLIDKIHRDLPKKLLKSAGDSDKIFNQCCEST